MTQLLPPLDLSDPDDVHVVYAGDSYKPQVTVRNGVKTSAEPRGAAFGDLTGKRFVHRINKIDRSDPTAPIDVTRDTDNAGEFDTTLIASSKVTPLYANTVTADWKPGRYRWELQYIDAASTPDDYVLVAIGWIEVRAAPRDS